MIGWIVGNITGEGAFAFLGLMAAITIITCTLGVAAITRVPKEIQARQLENQRELALIDRNHSYDLNVKKLDKNLITSHRESD